MDEMVENFKEGLLEVLNDYVQLEIYLNKQDKSLESNPDIQKFKDEVLLDYIIDLIRGEENNVKIIDLLVKYGSNIDFVLKQDRYEYNALHLVIQDDNFENKVTLLDHLLNLGADPNVKIKNVDMSPNINSIITNYTPRQPTYLPCSISPIHRAVSRTYLYASQGERIENCDEDVISLLIKNGADINEKDSNGNTPLHITCSEYTENENGIHSCCDLLLNGFNADPNIKNNAGNTPLHISIACQNVESARCLLNSEVVDTNIKNDNGLTPLQLLLDIVKPPTYILPISGITFQFISKDNFYLLNELIFKSNNIDELELIINDYEIEFNKLPKMSSDEEKMYTDIYEKIKKSITNKKLITEQRLSFMKHNMNDSSPINFFDVPERVGRLRGNIPDETTTRFENEPYPNSRLEEPSAEISEEPSAEISVPPSPALLEESEGGNDNPLYESLISPTEPSRNNSCKCPPCCTIMGGKKSTKRKYSKRKSTKRKYTKRKSTKRKYSKRKSTKRKYTKRK